MKTEKHSSISFEFDPIPRYFRFAGWTKKPKVAAFLLWSFSRCQSLSRVISFDGKEIKLEPYSFLFGRRKCAEECGLTEDEIRTIVKNFKKAGLLQKLPNKTPKRFTLYKWVTKRFSHTHPQVIAQQPPNTAPTMPHKEEKEENREKKKQPSEEGIFLANLLFQIILSYLSSFKKPNLHSWAKEFDKIIINDKRPPHTITALIKWLPSSEFWRKNILSPIKLRKQFDRLILEKESHNNNTASYQQDQRPLPSNRKKQY